MSGRKDTPKSGLGGLLEQLNALTPDVWAKETGTSDKLRPTDRENLHELLDALLDCRAAFEALPTSNFLKLFSLGSMMEPNPEKERLANAAFKAGITLLVSALGPMRFNMLPPLSSETKRAREVLWAWLVRLRHLLPTPQGGLFGSVPTIKLDQILEELLDLNLGDQGSFFAAAPRKPGQSRKAGKLARLRLKALAWERYLRSQGLKPGEAQGKVSVAYGASWNTIEKWQRRICVPLLQEWFVDFALSSADAGQPPSFVWLRTPEDALRADGLEYRQTLKAAKARTT